MVSYLFATWSQTIISTEVDVLPIKYDICQISFIFAQEKWVNYNPS